MNQTVEKVFLLDSLFPYPVDLRVLDHVLDLKDNIKEAKNV